MAQAPLTRQQLQEAVDTVQRCGGTGPAAVALGIPENTLRSRLRIAKVQLAQPEPTPPPPPREPLNLPFEEAWHHWQRAIGMATDRYTPSTCPANVSKTRKILVIPDLHAPFHEPQMLADMLVREADADKVVMIGDVGDSYALSRFVKYERCGYREEWASVTLCIQEIASRFADVEIVLGNHDARLERQLRERLTEDMVDAIQCITGGTLCPITAIAKRYPNVTIARHETRSGKTVDWFTTVGDAWFGHPEKFSRVPGAAIRAVDEWITDNENVLDLNPIRLVVLGHTHQMSWIPWKSDRLLVECGCLAADQGYMLSPRIGGRPQRRGYLTFNQRNGLTDLNSVKLHWFDAT